jgi:hypothetical protein
MDALCDVEDAGVFDVVSMSCNCENPGERRYWTLAWSSTNKNKEQNENKKKGKKEKRKKERKEGKQPLILSVKKKFRIEKSNGKFTISLGAYLALQKPVVMAVVS